MKHPPFLILACDAGWLPLLPTAVRDASAGSAAGEHARPAISTQDFLPDALAVAASIHAKAGDGEPAAGVEVVIALPSHHCFAARVSADDLPARQVRQALAYRFEPTVPFAVEDLVLAVQGRGRERLVVATRFAPLRSFVHELEDAGCVVRGIAPLALLAAQSVGAEAGDQSKPHRHRLAVFEEPAALCESQTASSCSEITFNRQATAQREVDAWRWRPGSSHRDTNDGPPPHSVSRTLELAHATVSRVVADAEPLWIDLQQGPLASRRRLERVRRPLIATLAAAALLLIVGIGAMQTRAWQYREAAAVYDSQAHALYEDAFPGESVPVNMERRLQTRLRQLRGRQGLATPDAQLFAHENTLALLHDLLGRIPADTRLIITDLRIHGDRIDLVGQARSHSDADTLAAALRRDGRFEVTPPSTENLRTQGVQFSMNLKPHPNGVSDIESDALAAEQVGVAQPAESAAPRREPAPGGTP